MVYNLQKPSSQFQYTPTFTCVYSSSSMLTFCKATPVKTMGVQAISMVVLVVAAMLLVAPAEGRALLNLDKLIDHFLDCPPPHAEEAPAPEPAYSTPYYSPPDVEVPAPDVYNVPSAPEYQSPPGPPYADSPPPPISEPAPKYQTPPAGGY